METIFGLSSGLGRAGVAVIRISGPQVTTIGKALGGDLPPPRRAALQILRDQQGEAIDQGLVLFFPGPASFTGEDLLELQVHGSAAVIKRLVEVMSAFDQCRAAEPGEFTRRAFENDKLDLVEIEGLGDLIAAETEAQRRQALAQTRGEISHVYEDWRQRLLKRLAHLEASIDFSEEELPDDINAGIVVELTEIASEMRRYLAAGSVAERVREGARVAIVGAPNVGKSSLINYLAGRDVAIVSDIAGTTRDRIEVALDLEGFPVTLIDTAGLRETSDTIEREGVTRARQAVEEADLVLALSDRDEQQAVFDHPEVLSVRSKSDLGSGETDALYVSVRTGEGIDDVLLQLRERLFPLGALKGAALITRQRHRVAMERCVAALDRASGVMMQDSVLGAEDLRLALHELGRITGRVDVEDLLDVIFSDFCIGK